MEQEPVAHASTRSYWVAWLVLLAITLLMVTTGHPAVLFAGMLAKAAIILLWFMHLRYERVDFGVIVLLATVFTALALFALIAPDGKAM